MNNSITIPADWEAPTFAFGQDVRVRKTGIEGAITGIRVDDIEEYDVAPYSEWMYRVGARWYREDELVSGADAVVARVMSQPTAPRQSEDW